MAVITTPNYSAEYEAATEQAGKFMAAWRESLAEIDKLMTMLDEANALLRAAHDIASREGIQTNWAAFKQQTHAVLEKQHDVLNDYHDDQ